MDVSNISDTHARRLPPDDALRDWLLGRDSEMASQVEQWGDADLTQRRWLDALRHAYEVKDAPSPNLDVQAAFERVRERIGNDMSSLLPGVMQGSEGVAANTRSTRGATTAYRLPLVTGRFPRWAFGVMVATGLVIAMFVGVPKSRTSHGTPRTFATRAGEQATVTLDDGTSVLLAPRSMIRLLDFTTRRRTVELSEGEAFFDVSHASGAPFIVQSGPVTTRVLGTGFLVRYAKSAVHIAVADGRLRVSASSGARNPATLSAGSIYEATDSTVRTGSLDDIAPSTEWMQGQIVFHHTPVEKVLQAMSEWYGYHFRYADTTISRRPVTVGLSVRSSAEALATLEQLLRVDLTVVGDTVTLTPQHGRRKGMSPTRSYDIWTPNREVGR